MKIIFLLCYVTAVHVGQEESRIEDIVGKRVSIWNEALIKMHLKNEALIKMPLNTDVLNVPIHSDDKNFEFVLDSMQKLSYSRLKVVVDSDAQNVVQVLEKKAIKLHSKYIEFLMGNWVQKEEEDDGELIATALDFNNAWKEYLKIGNGFIDKDDKNYASNLKRYWKQLSTEIRFIAYAHYADVILNNIGESHAKYKV